MNELQLCTTLWMNIFVLGNEGHIMLLQKQYMVILMTKQNKGVKLLVLTLPSIQNSNQQTFCKELDGKYFRLYGPQRLCHNYSTLSKNKNGYQLCINEQAYISIKFCFQRQAMSWIWPMGHSHQFLVQMILQSTGLSSVAERYRLTYPLTPSHLNSKAPPRSKYHKKKALDAAGYQH